MTQGQLHLVKRWDIENFLKVFHYGEYHERCFSGRNQSDIPDYVERFSNIPKRSDELLDGGSIYWLINGYIQVRSEIWKINEIGIVTSTRPFATVWKRFPSAANWNETTDWAYLTAKEAPADLGRNATKATDVPLAMREKYQELNLMDWFEQP